MASPKPSLFLFNFIPSNPYPKASGVGVNQDCTTDFQDLKLRHKYKYLIYNLNKDNTQIITEKKGEDDGYEKFIDCLPETECRWAVYDFGYEHEGGKRNKLIFISWQVLLVDRSLQR